MYIGKLNQQLTHIVYQIYKKDTRDIPTMKVCGNPLRGEQLFISWSELYETGIDIHVSIDEGYLLNDVVLYLAQKSRPSSIKVFSADKETEFFCYVAETGKTITEKVISLSIEEQVHEFVIEINVAFSDVIIDNIELYGADFTGETLFPTPVEYSEMNGQQVLVSFFDSYSFECEAGENAANVLKEKFEEITGISLHNDTNDGKIKLICNTAVPENGYTLTVTTQGARIEASDVRGMVYGAEVFLKLFSEGSISECTIKDYPRMAFRGVHLMLPHPSQFDFAKRLVKYVLSPMGYNCIIMEIAGGMEFESHPEINQAVEEAYIKGETGEWPELPHKSAGCGATVKKELIKDFICRRYYSYL